VKKLIIGLLLMAGVGYCGQLTYTTTEVDNLLTRVNETGWATYADTVYVSTNKLTVNNARTQVTVDGLGGTTETNYLPASSSELWSTNSNKVISSSVGNAMEVRVQFVAQAGAINTFFDIEFDIGAGTNCIVILDNVEGAGVRTSEHSYTLSMSTFSLATFVANGCRIYLNTEGDGSSWTFWDFRIFIKQDYYATP
jgi:hypothetical protein